MDKKSLSWIFISFLILSLFLREIPYINVYITNFLWIFYGILFFFLVFSLTARHFSKMALVIVSEFFLFGGLVLTLFKLPKFSEIAGIFVYFMLWLAVVIAMVDYIKSIRG